MDETTLKQGMFKKLGRPAKQKENREGEAGGIEEPLRVEFADDTTATEKVRLNVFITRETHEYLKKEAARSATTVSALMSMAISDWAYYRKQARGDNPEMMAKLDKYLSRNPDWPETMSRITKGQK